MANNILYKMQFHDCNDNECVVYIKKANYSGDEIEVNGGPQPCVIRMLADGDGKFVHIKATECILQLVSTTSLQYLELFTTTASKDFKVEVHRGATPIWIGWVNPEYYSEPLMPAPYITTVSCSDGLVNLKSVDFPIPGYTTNDFNQTIIHYVWKCLEQVGLSMSMDIYCAVNLLANTTTDGQILTRVWENLYIDYRSFQDNDGKFWSCYDVLNSILESFNARVYQWGWNWWIERVDQKHGTFAVEGYDGSTGIYTTTTSAFDAVTALTAHVGAGTDIRFINSPAMLEVQPAYKGFTINQDYGNRPNLIDSTSLKPFSANDWVTDNQLRFWSEYGDVDYTREYAYDALRIKGIYTDGTDYLGSNVIQLANHGVNSLTNLVTAWQNGEITLVFSFDVGKRFYARRDSNTFVANVVLSASFSGTVYRADNEESDSVNILGQYTSTAVGLTVRGYNKESKGSFTPAADLDTISIDLKDANDWVTTTIEFLSPPEAELSVEQTYINLQILLRKCATNLSSGDLVDTDGLLFRNMRLYFKKNLKESTIDTGNDNVEDYARELSTTISTSNILESQDYEVKFGNTPSPWGVLGEGTNDGCRLVNKYVIVDSGNKAVNYYGYTGDTRIVSFLVDAILANDLTITYRQPLFKLRGKIIDTTDAIDFTTCLKDYNERYYIPTGLAYNMKDATWEGEWLQMWNDSDSGGEFNDDFSDDFWT